MVLAIVGIMAAIAFPAFSSWREKQAVQGAARTLLSSLKQARVLALAENRSVHVKLASNAYLFDADVTGSCGPCRNESVSLSTFSPNLTLTPQVDRTFTSRGTFKQGNSSVTIQAGGACKKITTNIIGRSYIQSCP